MRAYSVNYDVLQAIWESYSLVKILNRSLSIRTQLIPSRFPYFILVVKALFLLRQRNAQNYALETYWLSELLEIPAALPENMLADVEADLRTDAIRRL